MAFMKLFQGKDAETDLFAVQMVDILVAQQTGAFWVDPNGSATSSLEGFSSVNPQALAPDPEISLESTFRHFKGGRYRVILLARYLTRPEEAAVVYASLNYGTIWVRSAKAWLETTDRWPDGRPRHRFQVDSAALGELFSS